MSSLEAQKLELVRLRREQARALHSCFIPTDLKSRPKGYALEVVQETNVRGFWIIGPNRSSKTSLGAREVSWWFQNLHPFKSRPKEWGDAPLLIIIAGRTGQILEEEIWKNKLKPLLPPGSYKNPKNDSGSIKSVEHATNGNRILFMSHHDAKNAREKAQGFTAHIVWLDEMPDDRSFISELILRVAATGKVEPGMPLSGFFYATFTPLVEDEEIKNLVEEAKFPFKKYVLRLEDNPIYEGWTSEQLDDLVKSLCADPVEFRSRRYGEWYYSGDRVFRGYDPTRNRKPLPFAYSPRLQHVVVVDPAASGKVGVSIWALHPGNYEQWWCVYGKKFEGEAASLLVKKIEMEAVGSRYVLKDGRICDCSPSGFYKEAQLQGYDYIPYRDKNDKKKETIEEVNRAYFNEKMMIAETPETEELHKEQLSAKWKPQENEIVNSHKYHLADTARYFWLKKPSPDTDVRTYQDHYHRLKQDHLDEQKAAAVAALFKQKSNHWNRSRRARG